jgi:hypothetical protein
MNPVNSAPSCVSKVHYNIVHPSKRRSEKRFTTLWYDYRNACTFYGLLWKSCQGILDLVIYTIESLSVPLDFEMETYRQWSFRILVLFLNKI